MYDCAGTTPGEVVHVRRGNIHRMIDDVLRTSRRRFLTQVGAAGLGIGVPVSIIAAGTQAPWPIREPNGGEFESFWPYLIRGA